MNKKNEALRCIVVGKQSSEITWLLRKHGLRLVNKNPDYIVAYGGDGSVLYAQRTFPGVPILCLRSSELCPECKVNKFQEIKLCKRTTRPFYCKDSLDDCVRRFRERKFELVSFNKLEAYVEKMHKKKTKYALNEVQLRNANVLQAARFDVLVNEEPIQRHVVADGLVVASPYGSTAYFYAITRKKFKKGLGVAFNNPMQQLKPLFLKQDATVRIIARRNALALFDNDFETIHLLPGEHVDIRLSKQKAEFVKLLT